LSSHTTILIVDDVEQNLLALEALLRRPGLNILKASSADEALEQLLEHDVALALIDVQMPQIDGFELAELMRGNSQTRDVPLIFITASDVERHRGFHGYRTGAVDFLHKPIDGEMLQSKVEIFIRIHEQNRQLRTQLDELRKALQMNDMFVAVLGHDLRNALSTIEGGALLLPKISTDPRVTAVAARMRASSRRMVRMADQLLDVELIRSGGLTLRFQSDDIEDICRHAVDDICQEIHAGFPDGERAAPVEITAHGAMQGCFDRQRVGQIVSNLVSNALLHGTADAPAGLSIDGTSSDAVMLHVTNRGTIPFALMPDLFKPFHLRREIRSPSGGLGLGLYIARELARAHGGSLTVRSTERDGTDFQLLLPRLPTNAVDKPVDN
jgi:signal transduction histidine kinase